MYLRDAVSISKSIHYTPDTSSKSPDRRRVATLPEDFITRSQSPIHPSRKRSASKSSSLGPVTVSAASTGPNVDDSDSSGNQTKILSESGKAHLLLIDQDDQIVYSGPSTGIPLFARLGLLHTVEVSESDKNGLYFSSHSGGALGIIGASRSSYDCFDLCLQRCPQELMFNLIRYHLTSPLFFPVLHAPSLLSEFVAVTKRRLICTPQYGAFLMSILAVTVRLVENAKFLLPPSERDQASESYFELAQDLLRSSKNNLDIRHILALYHLALFTEGRNNSTGPVSTFVAEAIGLAFTTGLHRNTRDFKMDPVTLQIRTRLFWALYSLDISLAYSQGRPPLIRLSECSVDLPVIVDNEYVTKTTILPQPESSPPVAMAAAVEVTKLYMVLEQVLSAINAPSETVAAAFSLDDRPLARNRIFIERDLPPYLSQVDATVNPASKTFHASRVRATVQFVRTLIARQALIDGFEANPSPTEVEFDSATFKACHLSIDIIKTYSRLRHTGHLRFCGFQAVSHVTAAAHTLIACMLRNSDSAFEYRPDLLTAIDLLLAFSAPFPSAKTIAQLLVQISRTLDYRHGSTSETEAAAIRVLARKFAPPLPKCSSRANASERQQAVSKTPALSSLRPPLWQYGANTAIQQLDSEALPIKHFVNAGIFADDGPRSNYSSLTMDTLAAPQSAHPGEVTPNFAVTTEDLVSSWGLSSSFTSLANEPHQWAMNNPLSVGSTAMKVDSAWEDGVFSFLNDGLFNNL
ncbi:uncharacterized protein TRUGW13939_02487 [Talaromyces rugulosus]|uniref:Xylanolytic transcriptional activator regulatory domain-containing protein n=1 Tax=Talaromyces rugulosus TaxID=121627 RepID=A0A7H8QN93_TALRU|nr:uncharacterized protein TRUGW13939_02487 [Talaromyces rugulosus]QKX55394.1 hypothetical protein TRUGW13939_02487 [Talaromyces rugulosus]